MAVSALLAGCSSGGGSDATPTATDSPTGTPSPTATATETPTETASPTPAPPTVEDFAYPDGASRSGIDAGTLYSTHRSAITDAGSATVDIDRQTDYGDFSESLVQTSRFGSGGLARTSERNDLTETLWSPSDADLAYVQMDTGFEQRYRIDNQAPRPQDLLKLRLVQSVLSGATWGEASEVVETAEGEYAAVYESTGIASEDRLLDVLFGRSLSEFSATIEVAESGHVSAVTYDITVERRRRTVQRASTVTTGAIGATTVSEPSWAGTARENGVRFEFGTTDDGTLVTLELVNGTDVPSETRANLSTKRFASGPLGETVAVGDTLYLGISGSEQLLTGVNSRPDGATTLEGRAFATLRQGQFTLFEGGRQL